MSKKYKLLKDTPDSKAGDLYVYTNGGGSYAYYKDGCPDTPHWFFVEHVEGNPEWFEEVKEKGWQIMEGKHPRTGEVHSWLDKTCGIAPCKIHSVKRMSDNSVWSAMEETNYGTIERFYIGEKEKQTMCVHFTNGNGATLASLEKLTPQPRHDQPPRVVTDSMAKRSDGTSFRLGEIIYCPKCLHPGHYKIVTFLRDGEKTLMNVGASFYVDIEDAVKLEPKQPEPEIGVDFLTYLIQQKEKCVKEHKFETASQWRLVEKLYREHLLVTQKPSGRYISLEEVVEYYLKSKNDPARS